MEEGERKDRTSQATDRIIRIKTDFHDKTSIFRMTPLPPHTPRGARRNSEFTIYTSNSPPWRLPPPVSSLCYVSIETQVIPNHLQCSQNIAAETRSRWLLPRVDQLTIPNQRGSNEPPKKAGWSGVMVGLLVEKCLKCSAVPLSGERKALFCHAKPNTKKCQQKKDA